MNIAGKILGTRKPVVGMKVMKSGARTGVTYGKILSANINNVVIISDKEKPAINNEISKGGDSGSLWVTEDNGLYAVALHHSGDKSRSPTSERAWANSAEKVAAMLDISFV